MIHFKRLTCILVIFIISGISKAQVENESNTGMDLLIEFPDLKVTIPDLIYDDYSSTEIKFVKKENALIELGLGDEIWKKQIELFSDDITDFKIYQRYETSITISDEGPHLDLTDWKHYESDWKELKLNESNECITADYESNKFVDVDISELKEAVREKGGDYWYHLVKDIISPSDYPSNIGISKVEFRITGIKNGKMVTRTVLFIPPLGC